MNQDKPTRKNIREKKSDSKLVTVKIAGQHIDAVAEIQDLLSKTYGNRVYLSPILRSEPNGFHAFATLLEEHQ